MTEAEMRERIEALEAKVEMLSRASAVLISNQARTAEILEGVGKILTDSIKADAAILEAVKKATARVQKMRLGKLPDIDPGRAN